MGFMFTQLPIKVLNLISVILYEKLDILSLQVVSLQVDENYDFVESS
jgi:hypothetical protein